MKCKRESAKDLLCKLQSATQQRSETFYRAFVNQTSEEWLEHEKCVKEHTRIAEEVESLLTLKSVEVSDAKASHQ